jgi:hypothetical protein
MVILPRVNIIAKQIRVCYIQPAHLHQPLTYFS